MINLRITLLLCCFTLSLFADSTYIVKEGDTLFSIARNYSTYVELLEDLNGIQEGHIYPDMELQIPGEAVYTVKPGDTLSEISQYFQVSLEQLMNRNHLSSDKIKSGQKIRIPFSGDSLINQEYRVKEGDTLWAIASDYDLDLETLLSVNSLTDEIIIPGMILSIPVKNTTNLAAFSLQAPKNTPLIEKYSGLPEKGPWSGNEPEKNSQPSLNYSELSPWTPQESYLKAQARLNELDQEIKSAGLLSQDLKNWRIVIDPGHGGMDPGAMVESEDGLGNKVYIVEDEYAYDIALRLYSLLKQNGAETFLTIISPNHQIRSTPDASITFVNQKNEVYNSRNLNLSGSWDHWPIGGTEGLRKRKTAAREWIGRGNRNTLFVSIHCDNTEGVSFDNALLFWGANKRDLENSKFLAENIAPFLDGETEIRQQELEVLKNNPAEASVLIEVRNISDPDNSWILRKEELRNIEVMNIYEGLREYILAR